MLRHFMWVVCLYVISSFSSLGVELSPLTFRFPLEKSHTQELTVINGDSESVRYRVNIIKPDNTKVPGTYMGEWIRYYPKILSVPPKSTRVVRFRVNPPKGLEEGEYRAYLSLEEIPPKIDAQNPAAEASEEGTQLSLTHLMRFNLSLYGEVGELSPSIEFQRFDIVPYFDSKDKMTIKASVLNKGKLSTQSIAYITFKDNRGKKVGDTVEVILPTVVRGNTGVFDRAFPIPEGNIRSADVEIRYWTFTQAGAQIGDIIEQKRIDL